MSYYNGDDHEAGPSGTTRGPPRKRNGSRTRQAEPWAGNVEATEKEFASLLRLASQLYDTAPTTPSDGVNNPLGTKGGVNNVTNLEAVDYDSYLYLEADLPPSTTTEQPKNSRQQRDTIHKKMAGRASASSSNTSSSNSSSDSGRDEMERALWYASVPVFPSYILDRIFQHAVDTEFRLIRLEAHIQRVSKIIRLPATSSSSSLDNSTGHVPKPWYSPPAQQCRTSQRHDPEHDSEYESSERRSRPERKTQTIQQLHAGFFVLSDPDSSLYPYEHLEILSTISLVCRAGYLAVLRRYPKTLKAYIAPPGLQRVEQKARLRSGKKPIILSRWIRFHPETDTVVLDPVHFYDDFDRRPERHNAWCPDPDGFVRAMTRKIRHVALRAVREDMGYSRVQVKDKDGDESDGGSHGGQTQEAGAAGPQSQPQPQPQQHPAPHHDAGDKKKDPGFLYHADLLRSMDSLESVSFFTNRFLPNSVVLPLAAPHHHHHSNAAAGGNGLLNNANPMFTIVAPRPPPAPSPPRPFFEDLILHYVMQAPVDVSRVGSPEFFQSSDEEDKGQTTGQTASVAMRLSYTIMLMRHNLSPHAGRGGRGWIWGMRDGQMIIPAVKLWAAKYPPPPPNEEEEGAVAVCEAWIREKKKKEKEKEGEENRENIEKEEEEEERGRKRFTRAEKGKDRAPNTGC